MNNNESNRRALLGMSLPELLAVTIRLGLPKFAAGQIARWLYVNHADSIEQMTNLPKTARWRLSEEYEIGNSAPVDAQRSTDGTVKYLFRTKAGDYIESVYIPDGERGTLCVSSQVGCKMGCTFCMTGRQGYSAQLTVSDILNQIYSLPERDRLTNVWDRGSPLTTRITCLQACGC